MRYCLIWISTLVVCLVLAPATGLAQDDAPPPPPPVQEIDASEGDDREEPTRTTPERAEAEKTTSPRVEPFTAGRAAIETLTGFGMMLGGTLAGLLAGFLTGALITGPGSVESGVAAGIGGMVGYTVGTPLGIWMGGNAMNGNGSFWATFGGVASGILVGGALTGIVSAANPRGTGTGAAPLWMTVMPITGGIVGYELSSGPASAPDEGMSLQIGASPSMGGQGTMLNISGRW